jgi:O-antigen ligase
MNFPTERAAAALVFLYPVLLLSVRSGTNACFLFLIILAVFELLRTRRAFFAGVWDNTALLYSVAMASLAAATVISQGYHMKFTPGPYDGVARFLFAIPVYLLLRRLPTGYLTVVQYGFIGGALAAMLVDILYPVALGGRLGTFYLNVIHFGDLALILGLIAVLTINWDRKDGVTVVALKIAALIAGLWVSIQSGTRGGWLAIPFVTLVWAALAGPRISLSTKLLSVMAVIVTMLLVFAFASPVHERVNLLVSDFYRFEQVKDTSTGLRIQIWSAALHLFAQHPIFGVGPDQFASYVPELTAAGYLTPMATDLARAEVHNEILTRAVTLGVFGLASILLIYFAPLALFLRAARADGHVTRTAGMLGACFVVGFFVFGLTVETFDLKATATFYSLTVAVLLAIATNRGAEKPQQTAIRSG